MIDWKARAEELLHEYSLCCKAKPRHGAIEVQLEKDAVGKWAKNLTTQLNWGTDTDIAEACYQLEPKLQQLKEKLVIEVLKHGAV